MTGLYWIFDSAGLLIYVGVSDDPVARFGQHASTAAWWSIAARHEVQWYRTRDEAEAAETAAIRRYDPYFNRAHSINPPGNPAHHAGVKALCDQLGVSRPDLVMLLIDRELAARGLLVSLPCYHSALGWPDGVAVDVSCCGRNVGTTTGAR